MPLHIGAKTEVFYSEIAVNQVTSVDSCRIICVFFGIFLTTLDITSWMEPGFQTEFDNSLPDRPSYIINCCNFRCNNFSGGDLADNFVGEAANLLVDFNLLWTSYLQPVNAQFFCRD